MCQRLSTLHFELQITDITFISDLLHCGTSSLQSLSLRILCNDCKFDVQPQVDRWRQWFDNNLPLKSTVIRFTLNFNRHGVASWLCALNEAVEISEQALQAHLLLSGMTILGIVEHPVPPLEFTALMF